jgi:hypothetical protein
VSGNDFTNVAMVRGRKSNYIIILQIDVLHDGVDWFFPVGAL